MTSICYVCDLPVQTYSLTRHMNRAHNALTCSTINELESHHQTENSHFLPNRWVDCNICLKHCLDTNGLTLHTKRTHVQPLPLSSPSPPSPPYEGLILNTTSIAAVGTSTSLSDLHDVESSPSHPYDELLLNTPSPSFPATSSFPSLSSSSAPSKRFIFLSLFKFQCKRSSIHSLRL